MKTLTRPIVLVTWMVLVALAGVAAAATHDDETVATSASSSTTTTTTTTTVVAGDTVPGSTDTTAPIDTTPTTAAGTAPATTAAAAPDTEGDTTPAGTDRIMPTPGTYTVAVQGTASLLGKPQPVPAQGTFTIEQLNATDTHQTGDFDLTLHWAPDSASLVSLKVSAAGITKDFEANPPVLFVPFPGDAGRTWDWTLTSTDKKTTVSQHAEITGADAITVEGQSVPVFIVHSVLNLSGDVSGTADLTLHMSPDHRLPIRQHIVVNAANGAFKSDTTSQLVSLTPA